MDILALLAGYVFGDVCEYCGEAVLVSDYEDIRYHKDCLTGATKIVIAPEPDDDD